MIVVYVVDALILAAIVGLPLFLALKWLMERLRPGGIPADEIPSLYARSRTLVPAATTAARPTIPAHAADPHAPPDSGGDVAAG